MRLMSTEEAELVTQLWTRSSGVACESAEAKLIREKGEWLRKLEAADGVRSLKPAHNITMLRSTSNPSEPVSSAPQALRRSRSLMVERGSDPSSESPSESLPHGTGSSPPTTPVQSKNNANTNTSPARSDAPSPPTGLRRRRSSASLESPLALVNSKRRRLSFPELSSRPMETLLVPPASSSQAALTVDYPTKRFFWSELTDIGDREHQCLVDTSSAFEVGSRHRHPFLEHQNCLLNPLDVLWSAGWIPIDRSEPFVGERREGFIFVNDGEKSVSWLLQRRGAPAPGPPRKNVWIVNVSALATRGMWQLGSETLAVF